MSFGTWGFRRITTSNPSTVGEVYRAIQVLEDCVVTVNNNLGDDLSNQFLIAGTVIFGEFSSISCTYGTILAYKARP